MGRAEVNSGGRGKGCSWISCRFLRISMVFYIFLDIFLGFQISTDFNIFLRISKDFKLISKQTLRDFFCYGPLKRTEPMDT